MRDLETVCLPTQQTA